MKQSSSLRRLIALCRKETFQIFRDPSSNLIAFALPVLLLLIFGYGIDLDSTVLRVGLILQDTSPEAREFAASLKGSPYLNIIEGRTEQEMKQAITADKIRGYVVVQPDFSRHLNSPGDTASVLVATDGSEPNLASFVENYVQGAVQVWMQHRGSDQGQSAAQPVNLEARFWMNP